MTKKERERKYKRYNKRKVRKSYKSKKRQKIIKKNLHCSKKNRQKEELVTSPKILSLLSNPDGTIDFLQKVHNLIHGRKRIKINLDEVSELTPDAILYLLLLFKEADELHVAMRGSPPKNSEMHDIFIHSGFYDYVKSGLNKDALKNNPNILMVQSGTKVEPTIATTVKNFVARQKPNADKKMISSIYSILIESMENTNDHASEKQGEKAWWIMALNDKKNNVIHFAFVDDGLGIAKTVRTNFFEKILPWYDDSYLLEQAANGEYKRSKTNLENRGKGLPQIKGFANSGKIRNLVFMSNKGYYCADNGNRKTIKELKGSVIAWDFV